MTIIIGASKQTFGSSCFFMALGCFESVELISTPDSNEYLFETELNFAKSTLISVF